MAGFVEHLFSEILIFIAIIINDNSYTRIIEIVNATYVYLSM